MADSADLVDLLGRALALIPRPEDGLPDAAFAFALRIVPMVNVDLLVRDGGGRTLLAWRDDADGRGWHVPGGIIRRGETAAARIALVADGELGLSVEAEPTPCHVHQFNTGYGRGHFISLVFRCRPVSAFRRPALFGDLARPEPEQIAWFAEPPADLYPLHRAYSDMVWRDDAASSASRPRGQPRAGS